MLNAHETQLILEQHFKDCKNYWLRSGYCKDEREAFVNAIDDIKALKRNPFVPCGDLLDVETKEKFIKYRIQDLG
jgi:hypothetical protein